MWKKKLQYDYNLQIIRCILPSFDMMISQLPLIHTRTKYTYHSNRRIYSNLRLQYFAFNYINNKSHHFESGIVRMLYFALVRSILEFSSSIWLPYHTTHTASIESTQKQMVIFLNGDRVDRSANNYVLMPYVDRCKEVELIMLRRRHVNAVALFIHAIISGRFSSKNLRSDLVLNNE